MPRTGFQSVVPQTNLTLSYDALSRLTAANDPDYSQAWSYDANGNRLSQWHSGEQLQQQAQLAQTQAKQLSQQASAAQQQADRAAREGDKLTREAQRETERAAQIQQHADELAQQAQDYRARIVPNPNFVQRIKNAVYQALANFYQQWADKRAAQASERQQQAEALTQQAQAKTEEATQLQQHADSLSQQAQAKQQEAYQLQTEANDRLQQPTQLEQQAAEYRQLAEQGGGTPATPQTTLFVYDEQGQLIGEYDEAGNAKQETVWLGSLPVATHQNGQTYAVHTDHLGTPRVITNSSYTEVWRWDSDPFGTTQANEDSDNDGNKLTYNLRFPGQYFDAETGLHYNYFRDYDPATGRYIESDPIGLDGGLNTYAYVSQNPITHADPRGLVDSTWNSMYPDSFNTQENWKGPIPADVDTACWMDCQLKKKATCMAFGVAGGDVAGAVAGAATEGIGFYPGFYIGSAVTTFACEQIIPIDCRERCKSKSCDSAK